MRSLLIGALLLTSCNFARAEIMEVDTDQPLVAANLPNSWDLNRVDRGIEAISQDKDAFVWVESYLPEELDAIIAEHNAYWKEQGVEITGHETSEHAETGGKYAITEETATENGKPTRLLYAEYDLGLPSKRNIIVTYWASPEGDKKYNNAVADIFSSMTITEK